MREPIDRVRLMVEARILAWEQGLDHEFPIDRGWALVRDAARTVAAQESRRSRLETFGAPRPRLLGKALAAIAEHRPSPRALDRAAEIRRLCRHARLDRDSADRSAASRSVWLHALGLSPRFVRAATGVAPHTLARLRRRFSETLVAETETAVAQRAALDERTHKDDTPSRRDSCPPGTMT